MTNRTKYIAAIARVVKEHPPQNNDDREALLQALASVTAASAYAHSSRGIGFDAESVETATRIVLETLHEAFTGIPDE